ncbi:MAG: DNA-binding protein [Okeania sp. SIO2H7]|nr:DNA-binding protein [Okeania sp. SIO2H7]
MIKNELEYQVTQDWVKKFKGAIAAAERDEERKKNDRERWQINRDVLQVHLDGLLEEIAEYEMLLAHDYRQPLTLTIDEFNRIPQLLIKARMAAKLTQKELGYLAKISEEKICFYEEKEYEGASFSEVLAVIFALDLRIVNGEVLLPLDTLRRTPIKI